MRLLPILVTAAGLTGGLAQPVFAQGSSPLNLILGDRGGICTVGIPREGRTDQEPSLTLEFGLRARDGNLSVTVKTNSWSFVEGKDTAKTFPMTLRFNTGKSISSRSGGYESGFYQQIWGGWGAGAPSMVPLAMLKDARSVSVSLDRTDLGQWNLRQPGFVATILNQCVERLNAAPPK